MRIFLVLIGWLLAGPVACGGPQYGIGQGQPPYPERSVTAPLPLAITSVFVAKNPSVPTSTQAALGYVQLSNRGSVPIDFSAANLSLACAAGVTTLDPTAVPSLGTPLQPNETRALIDASLAPFSQSLTYPDGQVAIIDDTYTVQAYLGWGTAALAAPYPRLTTQALDSAAIATAIDNFTVLRGAIVPATSVYITPAAAGGVTLP